MRCMILGLESYSNNADGDGMNWETLSIGNLSVLTFAAEQGKLVVGVEKRLLELASNGQLRDLKGVEFLSGRSSYRVSGNYAYISSKGKLWRSPVGEFNFSNVPGVTQVIDADITDKLATITQNKVIGSLYNPETGWRGFSFASRFDYWNNNHFEGMALIGDDLYLAIREGAKYWLGKTQQPIARDAVVKLNLQTLEVTDWTDNLNCLNQLSKPFGIVRSLITNSSRTKIYVTTEQGVYERSLEADKWTEIDGSTANMLLYALPNDEILVVGLKGQREVRLYRNQDWANLPNLATVDGQTVIGAGVLGNKLFVALNNQIRSIDLNLRTGIYPRVAKYLNLSSPTAAVRDGETVYLANENLVKVDLSGNITQLDRLTFVVDDIELADGGILLAHAKGLSYFKDGKMRSLAFDGKTKAEFSRVSVGDYVVWMQGYNLTVFDKTLSTLLFTTPIETILNDRMSPEDILVMGDRLFVVGYTKRKRLGVEVQIQFLKAYRIKSNGLEFINKVWDYPAISVGDYMADTRLYRIEKATPKTVLVLGESAGGNTIDESDGKELSARTLVKTDIYNNPYNSKSAHMTYYGIVDIEQFVVLRGQLSIARKDEALSNSVRAKTAAYGSDGAIYVGATASYKINDRDTTKFLGQLPPPYNGKHGDAALLKVANDMLTRHWWFTPGSGDVHLLDEKCALIGVKDNSGLPSTNPSSDTYLIVW